jgi:hypothetical protein
LRRRPGAVAVWLVVCLSVIIGIVALGMDGGRMMEERRRARAAADAAALAAATDLYQNYAQNQGTDPSGTAQAAALASAQANGYASDGSASVVTINIPPKGGPFAGQAEYVEVIIQANLPAGFSAIFTANPLQVEARAVAHGAPARIGLMLLQPAGSDSLAVSGNAKVQVVGAPVVANSANPLAYDLTGNATVSAAYHDIAGTLAATGSNLIGPVNMNMPPTADPLRALTAPDPTAYPVQAASPTSVSGGSVTLPVNTGGGVTLQPGVYRGGISISGNAAVTLAPGVYILDGGGLQVSGNASLTGNGVLLYNTGGSAAGSITLGGNGTITLTPLTTGPYAGISIFQDRNVNQPVQISGNGTLQLTGTVYAAAATIQLSGNGATAASTVGGGFIASQVQASGNGYFRVSQGSNRPRVPDIHLAE